MTTPWKNGFYRTKTYPSFLYLVDGENFTLVPASGTPSNIDNPIYKGTWKYGDFGEASTEVAKRSGKDRYDVEIIAFGGMWKPRAVLSDDGKILTHYGMAHSVDQFKWMSEEEVSEFKESGDPVDAPPNPYTIQPEIQGKLLWLSGAPGLGKSTSGLLLSKKCDYVYYEADAFMNHTNPYISSDVDEPSLAMMCQKHLKGVPQKRIDDVAEAMEDIAAMGKGVEYNLERLMKFYSLMCENISRERKRIGGDWVVAQAVPTRAIRDRIRSLLEGSNLLFVVLHMSQEDQVARIKARHGDDEDLIAMLTKTYEACDTADDDEPNAITVTISKEMTRDEVVEKIQHMVKLHCS